MGTAPSTKAEKEYFNRSWPLAGEGSGLRDRHEGTDIVEIENQASMRNQKGMRLRLKAVSM